ncbi:MAG: hypothetical protein NVS9B15_12470 [Acidobacteriaceae bacterium]
MLLLRTVRGFATIVPLMISSFCCAQKWQPVNPDELKMTSVKEAPGANAVILYREINGDDNLYSSTEYVRTKILTEAGRSQADIKLPFFERGQRVMDIAGRTIHPDGSIVNFNGKTFTKTDRYHGEKTVVKAFTLPEVTVGSIVEYKFTRRWDEYTVYNTFWEVQQDLYQKHAKFMLKMFQKALNTRGGTHLLWNAINLPAGTSVKTQGESLSYELSDIPGFEREENMPPYRELAMGVYIYYGGSDVKPQEFWKNEGKEWAKNFDHYIGHAGTVQDVANQVAPASLDPEQRLRKLYERAQQIRNISFERERTEKEAKAEDINKDNQNAENVIKRGYGSHEDINRAFIALARAAGFEASGMEVSSREHVFFNPGMLTSHQLKREIAVVQVNGKPVYLDPGTKFCPYGLLDWRYTSSAGIRQIRGGDTKLEQVPPPDPRQAAVSRGANLEIDADGNLSGSFTVLYQGLERYRVGCRAWKRTMRHIARISKTRRVPGSRWQRT